MTQPRRSAFVWARLTHSRSNPASRAAAFAPSVSSGVSGGGGGSRRRAAPPIGPVHRISCADALVCARRSPTATQTARRMGSLDARNPPPIHRLGSADRDSDLLPELRVAVGHDEAHEVV